MYVHRFLTNIDVLYAVFDHLDLLPRPIADFDHEALYNDKAVAARRALTNAALTCRAFSEPASKTLWKCLDQGLLPLLNTFSCFKETKEPGGGICYVSHRLTQARSVTDAGPTDAGTFRNSTARSQQKNGSALTASLPGCDVLVTATVAPLCSSRLSWMLLSNTVRPRGLSSRTCTSSVGLSPL